MVPRLNELKQLAKILNEHNDTFDYNAMQIVFKIPHSMLEKINEDIFYRSNQTGEPEKDVDEINVNIEGIRFCYMDEEKTRG